MAKDTGKDTGKKGGGGSSSGGSSGNKPEDKNQGAGSSGGGTSTASSGNRSSGGGGWSPGGGGNPFDSGNRSSGGGTSTASSGNRSSGGGTSASSSGAGAGRGSDPRDFGGGFGGGSDDNDRQSFVSQPRPTTSQQAAQQAAANLNQSFGQQPVVAPAPPPPGAWYDSFMANQPADTLGYYAAQPGNTVMEQLYGIQPTLGDFGAFFPDGLIPGAIPGAAPPGPMQGPPVAPDVPASMSIAGQYLNQADFPVGPGNVPTGFSTELPDIGASVAVPAGPSTAPPANNFLSFDEFSGLPDFMTQPGPGPNRSRSNVPEMAVSPNLSFGTDPIIDRIANNGLVVPGRDSFPVLENTGRPPNLPELAASPALSFGADPALAGRPPGGMPTPSLDNLAGSVYQTSQELAPLRDFFAPETSPIPAQRPTPTAPYSSPIPAQRPVFTGAPDVMSGIGSLPSPSTSGSAPGVVPGVVPGTVGGVPSFTTSPATENVPRQVQGTFPPPAGQAPRIVPTGTLPSVDIDQVIGSEPPAAPPPPVRVDVPPEILDRLDRLDRLDNYDIPRPTGPTVDVPLSEAVPVPEMGLQATGGTTSPTPTPQFIAADTAATAVGVPPGSYAPMGGGPLALGANLLNPLMEGRIFGENGIFPASDQMTMEEFLAQQNEMDRGPENNERFPLPQEAPAATEVAAEAPPAEDTSLSSGQLAAVPYVTRDDVALGPQYQMTYEQYLEMLRRFPGGIGAPQGLLTPAPISSGIGSLMG